MSTPHSHPSDATTQLRLAAADGDAGSVKALLAEGAFVNGTNDNQQTALMRAAFFGHQEVVRLLIAAGADTETKDKLGFTALDWSEARGYPEVAQLLRSSSGTAAPAIAVTREAVQEAPPEVTAQAPAATQSEGVNESILLDLPSQQLSRPSAEPIVLELGTQTLFEPSTQTLDPPIEAVAKPADQAEPDLPTQPLSELPTKPLSKAFATPERFDLPTQPLSDPPTRPLSRPVTAQLESNQSAIEPALKRPVAPLPATPETDNRFADQSVPVFSPTISEPASSSGKWRILLLSVLGIFAIAGIGAAYLVIKSRQAVPAPSAAIAAQPPKSVETTEVKSLPVVEGAIKGSEISVPEPGYPASEVSGVITVEVTVNSKGNVMTARSSQGPQLLRKAAEAAARKALFAPNKEWRRSGTITYRFGDAPLEPAPEVTTANPPKGVDAAEVYSAPIVAGAIKGSEVNVPEPEYPAAAKRRYLKGWITVAVTVSSEGSVIRALPSRGPQVLRNAAEAAARKAVFKPLQGSQRSGTITYYLGPLGQS